VPKVLSQAGISLADAYDVEGSIAGIEELNTREVQLLHEMGGTIFSERFSTTIRRAVSGDILQSANWVCSIADFPATPARVLAVLAVTDTTARLADAAISMSDPLGNSRELPFWVWDGSNEDTMRFSENGTLQDHLVLRPFPEYTRLPQMLSGSSVLQPQRVPNIVMRGSTTAFGAGNVEFTLLVLIAFAQLGGVSSRGLPLPSW